MSRVERSKNTLKLLPYESLPVLATLESREFLYLSATKINSLVLVTPGESQLSGVCDTRESKVTSNMTYIS